MFSERCAQSIRAHPERWGWYSRLRCSAHWLSLVLRLVDSAGWCFMVFHCFTCSSVCGSVPFCPCCSAGHPQAAGPAGMYHSCFWHESYPKSPSPTVTGWQHFSEICLSRAPCPAMIGYTLAWSFKVLYFFAPLLKLVLEPAAMIFICPPTQVTAVAPYSLNLVTSVIYMHIRSQKEDVTASSGQTNRLSLLSGSR